MILLRSDLEEITTISTVQRRLKSSSSKIPVNYSNYMPKLYKRKMGEADLMDQLKSAYQIDSRSKFRFYFLFFYLFDNACVNSFIVSEKLENSKRVHSSEIGHFFR